MHNANFVCLCIKVIGNCILLIVYSYVRDRGLHVGNFMLSNNSGFDELIVFFLLCLSHCNYFSPLLFY